MILNHACVRNGQAIRVRAGGSKKSNRAQVQFKKYRFNVKRLPFSLLDGKCYAHIPGLKASLVSQLQKAPGFIQSSEQKILIYGMQYLVMNVSHSSCSLNIRFSLQDASFSPARRRCHHTHGHVGQQKASRWLLAVATQPARCSPSCPPRWSQKALGQRSGLWSLSKSRGLKKKAESTGRLARTTDPPGI
jgi:hypothetical protein